MIESVAFFVKSFWGVALGFIAFIVWLVKLEAKSRMNTNRIDQLEIKICRQQDEAKKSRDELHEEIKEMRQEARENFDKTNENVMDIIKYMRDTKL